MKNVLNNSKTYHLHVGGIVQGVGFRPFVYKIAVEAGLTGTVLNGNDGVHIEFNATDELAHQFKDQIIHKAPEKAVISFIHLEKIAEKSFDDFQIIKSSNSKDKSVRLTPDYAICSNCNNDIDDTQNKRYRYAFTTCTDCGPRFSIIQGLPYDRERTSMDSFEMCSQCQEEYNNVWDRRYYSQTNSCPSCAIEITLQKSNDGSSIDGDQNHLIQQVADAWENGKIIAIKGIGGYLITCDATKKNVIQKLRKLKNRPSKPFGVMYPGIQLTASDLILDDSSLLELNDASAPIVLLPKKKTSLSGVAFDEIAPDINKLGVMLPYAPLYQLLLDKFQKPIIATSGNLSGDPIEYINEHAFENLRSIVDLFLHNDRPIVVPQDDSVISLSPISKKKVILRRSRGIAPSYISNRHQNYSGCILSMGGLLKSTFGLTAHGNIYISQYLGDTDSYHTQLNYKTVLNHFLQLFELNPQAVLIDKHPSYFSSMEGERFAEKAGIPLIKVQHHEAHFYAILGEYNLLDTNDEILGVIWDGTGLGDDMQIWGGEFFSYSKGKVTRLDHLPYFNLVAGDKMAKEPRISALSLIHAYEECEPLLKHRFSNNEWNIYNQLIRNNSGIKCSSAGRLFDGMAAIILDIDHQSYEGEAAMKLEDAADGYFTNHSPDKRISYLEHETQTEKMLERIIHGVANDKINLADPGLTAARFHISLADYIARIAGKYGIRKLAFSGGVFQNAWLIDLIRLFLEKDHELFFHQAYSANDENISFGQLMYYYQNILNEIP